MRLIVPKFAFLQKSMQTVSMTVLPVVGFFCFKNIYQLRTITSY